VGDHVSGTFWFQYENIPVFSPSQRKLFVCYELKGLAEEEPFDIKSEALHR
jgi:hypothetical protein